MSEHTASIHWHRSDGDFLAGRYSRGHTWTFDGGVVVPASASPTVVPLPYADPAGVDPEEAYVASIASCHMLWYLALAARRGFVVERYTDTATGVLTKDAHGKEWLSQVTLVPVVTYGTGHAPSPAEETAVHHAAHEACFIANSVRTMITIRSGGATPTPV